MKRFGGVSTRSVVALTAVAGLVFLATFLWVGVSGYLLWMDKMAGGHIEFVDEPGRVTKNRLKATWPDDCDPALIDSVSAKFAWTREGRASWTRIEASKDVADKWERRFRLFYNPRTQPPDKVESVEVVDRVLIGKIPIRHGIATKPKWWKPPEGSVVSTESMWWYGSTTAFGDSVGGYSLYDADGRVLWTFNFCLRGDSPGLWPRGRPPQGEILSQQFRVKSTESPDEH